MEIVVLFLAVLLADSTYGSLDTVANNTSNGNEDGGFHRIVGGQTASQSQFPYTTAVLYNNRLLCGGALLTPSHVVTAAHCTNGRTASQLSIRVGSNTYHSGGQASPVSAILQHPLYNSRSQDNDISILVLRTPVKLSSSVGVASVTRREPSNGEVVTVSGWGVLSEQGTASSSLRYVSIPTVGRSQCRARYGVTAITDNMICAGNAEGGKDSCQGDSGGPLVRQGTTDLVGIVSWGVGCGRPERPGVYTNTLRYSGWINQQTQGGSGAAGGGSGSQTTLPNPCDRFGQICSRTGLQFFCSIAQTFCSSSG